MFLCFYFAVSARFGEGGRRSSPRFARNMVHAFPARATHLRRDLGAKDMLGCSLCKGGLWSDPYNEPVSSPFHFRLLSHLGSHTEYALCMSSSGMCACTHPHTPSVKAHRTASRLPPNPHRLRTGSTAGARLGFKEHLSHSGDAPRRRLTFRRAEKEGRARVLTSAPACVCVFW